MSPSSRRRRTGLAACAAALGLVATLSATSAPAQAAEAQVDDAAFVWGLNGYAQKGIFGPWIFKDLTGNAHLLEGSVSSGSQSEYTPAPVPVTSMPASSPQKTPNAIKFTDGEGTIDPDTGAGTLSWTGSYTVNAYPPSFNAPNEVYVDPTLTVAANGSGTLTAEFRIGAGVDLEGNPFDAVDFGRLTIATFDAGSLSNKDETGYDITPDYQGVVNGLSGQTTSCTTSGGATGWWGSWPQEFIDALNSNAAGQSVLPHFYSTGCGGAQDNKPALPLQVTFTAEQGGEETPADDEQTIQVTVPEETGPVGEFVWAIDGSNDLVDLGTASLSGDHYAATGAINPVRVTDTRSGAPDWSVSARVGDFSTEAGTFDGKYLGWAPNVSENAGGAVAGAPVASGFDGGNGLKDSSVLGGAEAGHSLGSSLLGADLSLKLPVTTDPGEYRATLTLTALS
jgi:hypothetical protein